MFAIRSLTPNQRRAIPRLFFRWEKYAMLLFILLLLGSGTYIAMRITDAYSVAVPADGGIIREGIIGIPRFINPLFATSDTDRDLTNLVYTGLLRHDGNGNLIPSLAERYEISEDGLTYTFHLKKDAKWSDGTPCTADDVLFTISLAKDPQYRSAVQPNWEGVTVTKTDDYTAIFTLAKPYAPFLENTVLGIMPKHAWNGVLPAEFGLSEKNLRPVGAGPYRVVSFTQNTSGRITSFLLEPNPYFLPHAPYISNLELFFFTSAADMEQARSAGALDAASIPINLADKPPHP
ncbi:MAG: ABC transporter substrate-binding protein, partial [Patescibacteria group bacterium]